MLAVDTLNVQARWQVLIAWRNFGGWNFSLESFLNIQKVVRDKWHGDHHFRSVTRRT